jgi:hypothetical protein
VAGDPPGNGNEHDHPQVSFLPDGRLVVVWRDRRCCGGSWGARYQLFARVLRIRGGGKIARGRTVEVTAGPQQPFVLPLFDEYLGTDAGRWGVAVAWNQLRGGIPAAVYRRLPLGAFGPGALRAAPPARR